MGHQPRALLESRGAWPLQSAELPSSSFLAGWAPLRPSAFSSITRRELCPAPRGQKHRQAGSGGHGTTEKGGSWLPLSSQSAISIWQHFNSVFPTSSLRWVLAPTERVCDTPSLSVLPDPGVHGRCRTAGDRARREQLLGWHDQHSAQAVWVPPMALGMDLFLEKRL